MNLPAGTRKKVLIVAGEFPPLKTIGRIRSVKFAEHLHGLDWDCVVLTVAANGREPNFDPGLETEISEHTRVVRVPLETFEIAQCYREILEEYGIAAHFEFLGDVSY